MHQRIPLLVAVVLFTPMSVPGVAAQEAAPVGASPVVPPPTD